MPSILQGWQNRGQQAQDTNARQVPGLLAHQLPTCSPWCIRARCSTAPTPATRGSSASNRSSIAVGKARHARRTHVPGVFITTLTGNAAEDDRRGSNPRPSAPQSETTRSGLSWPINQFGLYRLNTPHCPKPVSCCIRLCSIPTAATLLPCLLEHQLFRRRLLGN
jgi:hypothetical protein